MKTITLEQFLTFEPCWLEDERGRERLERIAARKVEWTALDVLRLPDDEVSPADKLWVVLRKEFIDARTLHEFACICAERALTLAHVKDERCWNAIKSKRAWLRGEISDDELAAAWDAAWDAASAAASDAAYNAASDAWRAADSAAERKWQCEKLIELLESEGKTYE